MGEPEFDCFLGFWAGSHVGALRRGDSYVFLCAWGNFMC
jgi:hypothetical protein